MRRHSTARKNETVRMKGKDRRRQILDVAQMVFATEGYHGATTAKIAIKIGINEATLYHYFENKKHLFLEVLKERRAATTRKVQLILDSDRGSLEPIYKIIEIHGHKADRDKSILGKVWIMACFLDDPEIKNEVATYYQEMSDLLTKYIIGAVKRGVFRDDIEPRGLALSVISLMVESTFLSLTGLAQQNMKYFREAIRLLELATEKH